jgi:Periplasmic binding protein.
MKRRLALLIILAFLTTAAGCGAVSSGEGIRIQDSRGAEIVLDSVPERIVSLSPANTEILYALGVGDRIIAVSEYCNYPADTANKTKLPTGEKLNIETLISMKPDIIFVSRMNAMEDQIKQLEDAGIKVVVTEANNLDQTYEIIRMTGKVTGKKEEADKLVENMQESFEAIRKEAAKIPSKACMWRFPRWNTASGRAAGAPLSRNFWTS